VEQLWPAVVRTRRANKLISKKTDAIIHLLLVASDLAVRDGTSPASWCWCQTSGGNTNRD
jgi:hypothetical protein